MDVAAELAQDVGQTICEALQQEPLAGPEDAFRQSVIRVVTEALDQHENNYRGRCRGADSPLRVRGRRRAHRSAAPARNDQQHLQAWISLYNELRHHPMLPYKELRADLEAAFLHAGWISPPRGKART